MLTQQYTKSGLENQLTYSVYRKCVLAAINGMIVLEERGLPAQIGGGIVCRADNDKLTYWRDGLYLVFKGSPKGTYNGIGSAREMLINDLYALYIGKPTKTHNRPAKVCRECGQPFWALGNQQYCTHSCYLTGWQRRGKSKK